MSEQHQATNKTTVFSGGQSVTHSGSGNLVMTPSSWGLKAALSSLVLAVAAGIAVAAYLWWPRSEGPAVIRGIEHGKALTAGDSARITVDVPAAGTPVTLVLQLHDTGPASNCLPGTTVKASDPVGSPLEVRGSASEFRFTLPRSSGRVTVTVTVDNQDKACYLDLSARVA